MPRIARLDAPGVLHHVMIRGIEGNKIFHNNKDCKDFIERLAKLCPEMGINCYAWAFISNHAHTLNELKLYKYCGHGVLMGKSIMEWQNTDYVLGYFGKSKGEARKEYESFVTGSDALVESYSHGMKQRLELCISLLHDPKVLVVDEPMVDLNDKPITVFQWMMITGSFLLVIAIISITIYNGSSPESKA